MTHFSFSILFALLIFTDTTTFQIQAITQDQQSTILYEVTKIVDGDTLWARDPEGVNRKYRLIGINTPEFSYFGRPEQAYAQETTDFLIQLIGDNKLRIEYDIDTKDKYGRELVYLYLPDGTFINAELMRHGWAQVMTYPPNVKHADLFVKLQWEAREQGRGIWKL